MSASTRTTLALWTLAAAWAVGTAAWAQQPAVPRAAAPEPPVSEYWNAQAQARRPFEQILQRVRWNCEAYDKRKQEQRRAEEYQNRFTPPRPRPQVGDIPFFKPSPQELTEQERERERSERERACSPTEDEKRRLNEARCGWRECAEPLPTVRNAFVARVVPGWAAAVESSAQRVESSLSQMGDPITCTADTRAALASVATGLARWSEFAKTVQASVPEPLSTCSALCASLAQYATAICAADAVPVPAERAAAWNRAASQVTATSFPIYSAEACACEKARPSLKRVLESRARHATPITTAIAREHAERESRGRAEAAARAAAAEAEAARAAAAASAAAAAARAEALRPLQAAQFVARAKSEYAAGSHAAAASLLREALKAQPDSPDALTMLPEALRRQSPPDVEGALVAYRQAARLKGVALPYGRYLAELRRWRELGDVANRFFCCNAYDPELLEWRARSLEAHGRVYRAHHGLRRAVPADPGAGQPWLSLNALRVEIGARLQRQRAESELADRERMPKRLELAQAVRLEYGPGVDHPQWAELQRLTPAQRRSLAEQAVPVFLAAMPVLDGLLKTEHQRSEFSHARRFCRSTDMDVCLDLAVTAHLKAPALNADSAAAAGTLLRVACLEDDDSACRALVGYGVPSTEGPEIKLHAVGYHLAGCVAVGGYSCHWMGDFYTGSNASRRPREINAARGLAFYDAACQSDDDYCRAAKLLRDRLAASPAR